MSTKSGEAHATTVEGGWEKCAKEEAKQQEGEEQKSLCGCSFALGSPHEEGRTRHGGEGNNKHQDMPEEVAKTEERESEFNEVHNLFIHIPNDTFQRPVRLPLVVYLISTAGVTLIREPRDGRANGILILEGVFRSRHEAKIGILR